MEKIKLIFESVLDFFHLDALGDKTQEILFFVFIMFVTYACGRITRFFTRRYANRYAKLVNADPTNFNFWGNFSVASIYIIGVGVAIYTVPVLRTAAVPLFAGAGVLAAIIGFASQQAFSNVISGIFLVIFKPFRVDDLVDIDGGKYSGYIEDITIRHTVIRSFKNQRIIIPNAVISSSTITNYNLTDEKACKHFEVFITYESNMIRAMEIIQEEALRHPLCIDNREEDDIKAGEPVVKVLVTALNTIGVKLRANVWTKNPDDAFEVGCDLNKTIKLRFDAENIHFAVVQDPFGVGVQAGGASAR